MVIKRWLVTAKVNSGEIHYTSIIVEADSSRKALIIGKKKLLERYFYVTNMKCELIKEVKE